MSLAKSLLATIDAGENTGTVLTTGTFNSSGFTHLVVWTKHEGGATSISVSDNKGSGTFTSLPKASNGSNTHGQLHYVKIGTPGTGHTVTMTLGAARDFRSLVVYGVVADSGAIAVVDSAENTGNSNSPDAGSLVTGGVTTVSFMAVSEFAAVTYTPSAGWTEDVDGLPNNFSFAASRGPETTDPINPAATCSGNMPWACVAVSFQEGAAGPPDPDLTDVDTDEVVQVGQTGATFAGTDLEEIDKLEFIQGSVVVAQSITLEGDTGGTFDVVFDQPGTGPHLKHGVATARLTRDDATFDELAIAIEEETGHLWIDLTSINTDPEAGTFEIDTGDPLAATDQIEAAGTDFGPAPTGLQLNADGTAQWLPGATPAPFLARAYDNTNADVNQRRWGAWALQSVAGGDVTPSGIVQTQALEAPSIVQTHTVAPVGISQGQALGAPSISTEHQVQPGDLDQAQALAPVTIVQEHEVAPVDVAQAQQLGAPAIVQEHDVQPDSVSQAQELEAPALSAEHLAEPGDIAQAQELDGPTVTQDHQVSPADVAQAQELEPPTIEQVHALAVADMAQGQDLEAVVLVVEGTVNPKALAQVQQLGAVVITQQHEVLVADLAQLQELETPGIEVTHAVTVAGIEQAQAVEPVTIIVAGVAVPLTLAQQQALEAGQITQAHLIDVDDLVQMQVLGDPSAGEPGYLVVRSIRLLPALRATVRLEGAMKSSITIKLQ